VFVSVLVVIMVKIVSISAMQSVPTAKMVLSGNRTQLCAIPHLWKGMQVKIIRTVSWAIDLVVDVTAQNRVKHSPPQL